MSDRKKTVEDRLAQFAPGVEPGWKRDFQKAGLSYPPETVTLVACKQERFLEVWAAEKKGGFRKLREYPFTAFSGILGPKLREGDRQIPEGIYPVESLNPNSRFHLALRIGYPNEFDREQGLRDGRSRLGGDIMIHGKAVTIGCIPLGDTAIEELFVLAARTGVEKMRVIISPVDFRRTELPPQMSPVPDWADELYSRIRKELDQYR
ncbi:MAG: hypothetical protein SFY92_02435 [Verrucomicrobiae bacterium]|nr:hypothetical protein [Verrucomicrobiae bacterium]